MPSGERFGKWTSVTYLYAADGAALRPTVIPGYYNKLGGKFDKISTEYKRQQSEIIDKDINRNLIFNYIYYVSHTAYRVFFECNNISGRKVVR